MTENKEINPDDPGIAGIVHEALNNFRQQIEGDLRERRRYELAKGAMEAMMGNPEIIDLRGSEPIADMNKFIANRSVALADALLEKLEEKS